MNIGPQMESLCADTPWIVEESEAIAILLPGPTAARIHALNVPTWRTQPFVQATYAPEEIDALEAGLTAVADGQRAAQEVTCRMRRIVARLSSATGAGARP